MSLTDALGSRRDTTTRVTGELAVPADVASHNRRSVEGTVARPAECEGPAPARAPVHIC